MSSTAPEAPLIEIKNCTLMRGTTKALDDFSLSIGQNESVAIVGPNGSGKSSLLKLISRELYPLDRPGTSLSILGNRHPNVQDYQRHFGLVSQDLQNNYLGETPGLEVVISGFFASNSLWNHFDITDEQITSAKETMAAIQVSDLMDRLFSTLSTGQQRRLLLARALVHKPHTLILDEPTTGLDIQGSFRLINTIRNLSKRGATILLVTHHISEIPPEIDRIILMRSGKIFADGGKETVLNETSLRELFDSRLTLVESNGYYHVYPE